MLLTNRRHRLLFAALAGLEISWFLPWLALLLVYWSPRSPFPGFDGLALLTAQPVAATGAAWAVLLFYMLVADWLNRRQIDAPLRQLLILASLLLTTGMAVMALLYPYSAWLSSRWITATLAALFDFTAGLRPELILLLLNFYLWFRVAAFTDRDIGFFSVGLSFRVALLLALLGNGLLATLGRQPPAVAIQYFTLTIAFGLLAASLARIDDKALGAASSTGALMPWARLLQIGLVIGATIACALALAALATPDALRTVLGWTLPFWQFLAAILGQILIAVFVLLTPFFEWLAAIIQARLSEMPPPAPMEPMGDEIEYLDLGETIERFVLFRYCLVTGAVALAIGLLWLFFVRTQRRPRADEAEDARREESIGTGSGLGGGLDRLRAWLRLLQQYGLGQQLLAAVSVENIYANVLRMAARQGVKRPPATPPDRFLPRLAQLFPEHEDELNRITIAYMRVYYGGRHIASDELEQIRQDYRALRTGVEGRNA